MKKTNFSILLLIAVASLTSLSSCRFNCVKGSGHQTSETRKINDFTSLDISGGFKVNLKQDSSLSMTITGDDNLMKFINTDVNGGKLHIKAKRNFCENGQIVINIGVRNLDYIRCSGAVELVSDGKLNTKDLHLKLSGATKVTMDLNAANLRTESSGVSEIYLKGQATSHSVDMTGSGKLSALDFVVSSYNIETTGASESQINVLHDLSVHSTGASEVKYRGNPGSINTSKTGASSVTKIE